MSRCDARCSWAYWDTGLQRWARSPTRAENGRGSLLSNTRCTNLRCFFPPALQKQWRRRKTRRGHHNSRGQWLPAKADLGRANVDTVLHRRRHGQPLDDGARASCRFGLHTMHWVTPGRGRAASKRSRNSCSKSDFFGSFLPACECR